MQGNHWEGRQHHSWPDLCAGKQQVFRQLPCTTKTATIVLRLFYTWKWKERGKSKVRQQYQQWKRQQSTTDLDITMQQKGRQTKNSKRMHQQITDLEAIFRWPPLIQKNKIMTWNRCQFFRCFCTFSVLFYTFLYVGIFRTKEKT